MNAYGFRGRVALVTGGASGIGAATVELLRASGAEVAVFDLAPDGQAQDVLTIQGDVTSSADAEAAVQRVESELGGLDVLVCSAGVGGDSVRAIDMSDEEWRRVFAINCDGTFFFNRAAVRGMAERGYGRVVNVTSYTGLHGNVGQAAYAAAKAGIVGFTKTAAKELAPFGVTVNAISPNAQTRMVEAIPPERLEEIRKLVPLGRFAEPAEIAAAVLFLASEEAGYITGAVLPVDGGLSM